MLLDNTFRTVCPIKSAKPLSLDRILLLGSCFTNNIGERLQRHMVNASVNPTGILFNPESIRTVIDFALDNKPIIAESSQGNYFSWLLSGDFTHTDKDIFLSKAEEAFSTLRNDLTNAKTLIVTFGTAIVYALMQPPFIVVANCHKQPSHLFMRDMLTSGAIVAGWQKTIARLRLINPELRIIFTVSPVRHIKEGFHANTISKSILHIAIDTLTRTIENCEYFPAYELMLDDLRDYRFCAEDMAHPSSQAADYIFNRFVETYFTEQDKKLLANAAKLTRRLQHRTLRPDTQDAIEFANETQRLVAEFLTANPQLKNHY